MPRRKPRKLRQFANVGTVQAVSDAAATNNLSAADSAVAGDTAAADAAAVMPVQQIRLRVQVITSMDKVCAFSTWHDHPLIETIY